MFPMAVKLPIDGSYTSAVFVACTSDPMLEPPVIRTRSSASSVAVWKARGAVIDPVAENVPLAGS
jgi:hypothetical protein